MIALPEVPFLNIGCVNRSKFTKGKSDTEAAVIGRSQWNEHQTTRTGYEYHEDTSIYELSNFCIKGFEMCRYITMVALRYQNKICATAAGAGKANTTQK